MRRLLTSWAALFFVVASTWAVAGESLPPDGNAAAQISSFTGIYSGCQMLWTGSFPGTSFANTNTNQLFIEPGTLVLGGNVVNPSATQLVTVTGGTPLVNQTANFAFGDLGNPGHVQSSNSVYYVYAAWFGGGVFYVISLYQPNTDGQPVTGSLAWNNGADFSLHCVFIGSYITDSSGNIVPFLKEGDEVILTPNSEASGLQLDTQWQGSVQFFSTDSFPEVKTITLNQALIPLTATAVIVDFLFTNYDTQYVDARVLNAAVPTLVNGASPCLGSSQYYLGQNAEDGLAGRSVFYNHVRIKTAQNTNVALHTPPPGIPANVMNTLSIGACIQPTTNNSYVVAGAYVGYVEVNHHISL